MRVFSPQEVAFDTAVKRWNDFLYRGRADVRHLQLQNLPVESLIVIRNNFNDALAVEGQHITDHAPHPPFYFDYIDSDHANPRAFTDGTRSFIGVTIPLIDETWVVTAALSASDAVVTSIGLPLTTDRQLFHVAIFRLLTAFVVTHEYSHHVHGHLNGAFAPDFVEEIRGGAVNGNLRRQAREADADGYSAYFVLDYWLNNAEGRLLAGQGLNIEQLLPELQDQVLFSCFLVAAAGFTFLREPETLDNDNAYRRTHPPQAVRLNLLTRHVRKWCTEFRPALHTWMTQKRFQSLMDAVSTVI